MKIIVVGQWWLAYTLSWPAPLEIPITRFSSPSTAEAASRTARMQSGWNFVAVEIESVRHVSWSGRLGVAPSKRPETFSPRERRSKSRLSSVSRASTVSSAGARISSVRLTWPGIVLVLPGVSRRIPVDARAWCFVARRCEWTMQREASRSASALSEKGVEPVWASNFS